MRGPRAACRDTRHALGGRAAGCRGFQVYSPTKTLLGYVASQQDATRGNPEDRRASPRRNRPRVLRCYCRHLCSGRPLAQQAEGRPTDVPGMRCRLSPTADVPSHTSRAAMCHKLPRADAASCAATRSPRRRTAGGIRARQGLSKAAICVRTEK